MYMGESHHTKVAKNAKIHGKMYSVISIVHTLPVIVKASLLVLCPSLFGVA